MPSFCFDMIIQKHPVVFADLLNRVKSNALKIDSDSTGYTHDDPRLPAMFQRIEQRVRPLRGVECASFSAFAFHEGSWNGRVRVPRMPEHREVNVKHNVVGIDFFKVMRISLIQAILWDAGYQDLSEGGSHQRAYGANVLRGH
jgi:hypothetical protein